MDFSATPPMLTVYAHLVNHKQASRNLAFAPRHGLLLGSAPFSSQPFSSGSPSRLAPMVNWSLGELYLDLRRPDIPDSPLYVGGSPFSEQFAHIQQLILHARVNRNLLPHGLQRRNQNLALNVEESLASQTQISFACGYMRPAFERYVAPAVTSPIGVQEVSPTPTPTAHRSTPKLWPSVTTSSSNRAIDLLPGRRSGCSLQRLLGSETMRLTGELNVKHKLEEQETIDAAKISAIVRHNPFKDGVNKDAWCRGPNIDFVPQAGIRFTPLDEKSLKQKVQQQAPLEKDGCSQASLRLHGALNLTRRAISETSSPASSSKGAGVRKADPEQQNTKRKRRRPHRRHRRHKDWHVSSAQDAEIERPTLAPAEIITSGKGIAPLLTLTTGTDIGWHQAANKDPTSPRIAVVDEECFQGQAHDGIHRMIPNNNSKSHEAGREGGVCIDLKDTIQTCKKGTTPVQVPAFVNTITRISSAEVSGREGKRKRRFSSLENSTSFPTLNPSLSDPNPHTNHHLKTTDHLTTCIQPPSNHPSVSPISTVMPDALTLRGARSMRGHPSRPLAIGNAAFDDDTMSVFSTETKLTRKRHPGFRPELVGCSKRSTLEPRSTTIQQLFPTVPPNTVSQKNDTPSSGKDISTVQEVKDRIPHQAKDLQNTNKVEQHALRADAQAEQADYSPDADLRAAGQKPRTSARESPWLQPTPSRFRQSGNPLKHLPPDLWKHHLAIKLQNAAKAKEAAEKEHDQSVAVSRNSPPESKPQESSPQNTPRSETMTTPPKAAQPRSTTRPHPPNHSHIPTTTPPHLRVTQHTTSRATQIAKTKSPEAKEYLIKTLNASLSHSNESQKQSPSRTTPRVKAKEGKMSAQQHRTTTKEAPKSSLNPAASSSDPLTLRGKQTQKLHGTATPSGDGNGATPEPGRPEVDQPRPSRQGNMKHHPYFEDWMASHSTDATDVVDTNNPDFETGTGVVGEDNAIERPISHPETISQPGDDDDFGREAYCKKSRTAADAAKVFDDYYARLKEVEDGNINQRKERRQETRKTRNEADFTPNKHTPSVNIYVRPAEGSDMTQITDLYNHWVRNSVFASENKDLQPNEWQGRWEDAAEEGYAFLVAVEKGSKGGGLNRRGNAEVIVGFAYAEDYGWDNNAYQYTCEMQLWVHHQHLRAGIGKTLMDRMLQSLDARHTARNGTEFVCPRTLDIGVYTGGGKKVVEKIMFPLPVAAKDEATLAWMQSWLKSFDFVEQGKFRAVGRKMDQAVDLVTFIRATAIKANPLQRD